MVAIWEQSMNTSEVGGMGKTALRVLLAWAALAALNGTPSLAGQDYNPIAFSQPLKLSRGQIFPRSADATYLAHDESCRFLEKEQGWPPGDCDGIDNLLAAPAPGIDSAVVYKPVNEGYVRFDDWSQSKEQIDDIWTDFVDAMKAQSQRLNKNLVPEGWLVYPTLDKNKA